MIECFLPMIPPTVTDQMHRVKQVKGKYIWYDTPELKDARAKLQAYLQLNAPGEPVEGPVRLIVKWCFPKVRGRQDGQYKPTRPDADNLQKMLKDEMTKLGFWRDDAQVVSEIVEKFWADIPGIYIRVEEV